MRGLLRMICHAGHAVHEAIQPGSRANYEYPGLCEICVKSTVIFSVARSGRHTRFEVSSIEGPTTQYLRFLIQQNI